MTHLVLVFAVVVVTAVQSGACPTMCICKSRPRDLALHYTSVKCNNYHKNTSIELEDTTRDITLTNFNENELDVFLQQLLDQETRLPYFSHLTITNSVVPETFSFSHFSRLKYLTFSTNIISNLTETFTNVSSLQNLDLSQNGIVSITGNLFRTLQNLEELNLSANCLNEISSESFCGLSTLKCLDLSKNNLTELNDAVFTPLTSLQYLNLSQNYLQVLNERYFSNLSKLQQLDVSNNKLSRVELGSLQLPSLVRLLISGNPQLGVSREPPFIVGTGQRLQTVDASGIGLLQVPAALTHSIRTLKLANNSIRVISCGDLDSYPLLQLLDIHGNKLKFIEDDALGRLDSLSILYLADNLMETIPKSLSEKLKVLHLDNNKITAIEKQDLQGLVALEVLLLNDNKIRVIEAEAFGQLEALVTLDISRNPIKILEAGCLSSSANLQVLRLASIAAITPAKEVSFPLFTTEHLVTLDLSGSPGLARQLLVDTAALAAFRELQELDLSYTDLEFIRSDLLHFLPQLRILHINGNRINCTQLEWLASWMRRQDVPEYKKIVCASPPKLWGAALIDLQDQEIFTTKTIQSTSTVGYPVDNRIFEKVTTQPSSTTDVNIPVKKNDIPSLEKMSFNNATAPRSHNKLNELFPDEPSLLDVNSNSSHEHRSNGKTSMFSASDHQPLLHPGMLILAAGILGAVAALTMLAARFTKQRRQRLDQDDIEVNSLPGVTELW